MCIKLCFLRQGEDTFHRPQTLIVNLLPLCYSRSAGCQVSGRMEVSVFRFQLSCFFS